jgi:hypothetical protein
MPVNLTPAEVTADAVWIPHDRWWSIVDVTAAWKQYPGLVLGLIADRDGLWRLRTASLLAAASTHYETEMLKRLAEVETESRWDPWDYLAVVGVAVLACGVGVVGGVLLMLR